jgi:oxygen-independent coproporphyrinogen-3 oxidase
MMDGTLMKKYNVAGPRYTSYPTVPYWETNPTEEQWVSALGSAIAGGARQGTGAAIYAHIPFCQALCTYCGCNTRITRNRGVSAPYIASLHREFELYREKLSLPGSLLLSELHLGGGTPTYFSPSELSQFLDGILKHCSIAPDHEFSIEVDPRVTSREHLEVLREHRFRRVSLGIQDFDPKVQDIVHRIQSFDEVKTITDDSRALGFTSVNYDLIYGLPLQTLDSIRGTVEKVVKLRPDRIAFYAYAHVPWIKPGQRRFTEADLPSGDEKRALYELGRRLLEDAGYVEIGMDHFALKSDSLYQAVETRTLHRNFMGYTARNVNPILALGVSAIGDAWTAFAQNEKLLEAWAERIEKGELPVYRGHVLNQEDLILRKHILNLMTRMHTSWAHADERVEFLESVPDRLEELQSDGLLVLEGPSCRVTETGRAFLRNICMAFDARLVRKAPETRLFSQTV